MMMSYIKGTAECIFMHIHLKRSFSIYILTPVFVVPNIKESLWEYRSGETIDLFLCDYEFNIAFLCEEIANRMHQDKDVPG